MDEQEKKSSGFKIVDRRRVDEHGEDRDLEQTEPVKRTPAETASPAREVAPEVSSAAAPEGAADEINFSSFIVSLATQALMQLGQVKPPPGVDLPVDMMAARQTIDIISMLYEKTKGNLDKEEEHLIEEIVNSLRFQFIQKTPR